MSDPVALWISELNAAGWEKIASTVWKCPAGYLFRGPYGAWCKMHAHPELNVAKAESRESERRF